MRLMKVPEIAERLTLSESFVYARIADGSLKHYRLGKGQGGIRVSEEQLAAFLAERERAGAGRAPAGFTHARTPASSRR